MASMFFSASASCLGSEAARMSLSINFLPCPYASWVSSNIFCVALNLFQTSGLHLRSAHNLAHILLMFVEMTDGLAKKGWVDVFLCAKGGLLLPNIARE